MGVPVVSVDPIETAILAAGIDADQPTGLAAYLVAEAFADAVLAILAPGESRVTATDGTVVTARVEDGFLSVQGDTVTIVAGTAELV
jgi:hypothetical protein